MLSDPRSIAFIIECINPQMRPSPQQLQRLYAKMVLDASLAYSNFSLLPVGAQMGTVHGPSSFPGMMANSALIFGADRFHLKEEFPAFSVDEFITKAKNATVLLMNELAVPFFPVTQVIVRALVSVQGYPDSREFFNRHFFHWSDRAAAALGKAVNLFGLRMVFPGTAEDPVSHNVRIESFNGDVRSLFLEDTIVFPRPFTSDNLSPLEEAIRASYSFATQNVPDYLKTMSLP